MIKYENDYAYVDGYKFKKDLRDNYYLSSTNIGNRRKLGVDNIEKNCIKCGKKFEVNKYSKREQCYNCYPSRNKKTSK